MHEFNARLKIAQEELDNALDVLRPLVADRLENNAGSSSLSLDTLAFHPPVIDEYGGPWRSDDVVGLRKYVDGLEDTANALRKMRESRLPPKDDPLPSVLSTITFVKQLLTAERPIVGVRMSMQARCDHSVGSSLAVGGPSRGFGREGPGEGSRKGTDDRKSKTGVKSTAKNDPAGSKEVEAYVDVVARGGAEWIRVYSKKVSNLLAEFRDQDALAEVDGRSTTSMDDVNAPKSQFDRAFLKLSVHDREATESSRNNVVNPSPPLSNSLLTMVDNLLIVAESSPRPPGTAPPRITLRLSRIEERPPGGHPDSRIPATFEVIRRRGVKLIFGDLSDTPLRSEFAPSSSSTSDLYPQWKVRPAKKINLDPTAMIGLCSDLLHHPLPSTVDEAKMRFFRPDEWIIESRKGSFVHRKKPDARRGEGGKEEREQEEREQEEGDEDDPDAGQSQNSRELVKGLMEEMDRPLIEEMIHHLQGYAQRNGRQGEDGREDGGVEFWTTKEAALHVQEALSSEAVVGEGMEQQRMRRMLGLEEGDFFEGSRYEGREGCLKGFRVRIFDEDDHDGSDEVVRLHSGSGIKPKPRPRPKCLDGKTSFHARLSALCESFLQDYYTYMERTTGSGSGSTSDPTQASASDRSATSTTTVSSTSKSSTAQGIDDLDDNGLPSFLRLKNLPMPKVVQLSRPFTITSLHSIARGAAEGMTTLTMGSVVFRELWGQTRWRMKGWVQGNYEYEYERLRIAESETNHEYQLRTAESPVEVKEMDVNAVIWMMPYRSLGEGKRVKFAKGDYSYPPRDRVGSVKGFEGLQF